MEIHLLMLFPRSLPGPKSGPWDPPVGHEMDFMALCWAWSSQCCSVLCTRGWTASTWQRHSEQHPMWSHIPSSTARRLMCLYLPVIFNTSLPVDHKVAFYGFHNRKLLSSTLWSASLFYCHSSHKSSSASWDYSGTEMFELTQCIYFTQSTHRLEVTRIWAMLPWK